MDLGKFEKKEYFVNRELSWLKFDERVLSEARDKSLPLFDRLKFLSITASNLDEFFMVRVASLKDQVHAGYHKTDISGMTAKEQLKEISVRTHELVHVQYNTLNRSLIPALEKAGRPGSSPTWPGCCPAPLWLCWWSTAYGAWTYSAPPTACRN